MIEEELLILLELLHLELPDLLLKIELLIEQLLLRQLLLLVELLLLVQLLLLIELLLSLLFALLLSRSTVRVGVIPEEHALRDVVEPKSKTFRTAILLYELTGFDPAGSVTAIPAHTVAVITLFSDLPHGITAGEFHKAGETAPVAGDEVSVITLLPPLENSIAAGSFLKGAESRAAVTVGKVGVITFLSSFASSVPARSLDAALRIAAIRGKLSAGIRTVGMLGACGAVGADFAACRGITLAACCQPTLLVRLALNESIENALFAIITLFAGVGNAVPADFLLTESATAVPGLRTAGSESARFAEACIVGAVKPRITLALPPIVTLFLRLHDTVTTCRADFTHIAPCLETAALTRTTVAIHPTGGIPAEIRAREIAARIIRNENAAVRDFTVDRSAAGSLRPFAESPHTLRGGIGAGGV